MAKLIIHRAEPFRNGDFIIHIYVDGQRAGSLISENELELNLPATTHRVQARSLGLRGKESTVQLQAADRQDLQVAPIRMGKRTFWTSGFPFVLLVTFPPSQVLHKWPYLFYIEVILLLSFFGWSFYLLRKQHQVWLKLEDKSE